MSHYGYEIVQTLIVDIEPDEHVKRAMNEINAGKVLIIHLLHSWELGVLYIAVLEYLKGENPLISNNLKTEGN